MPVTASFRLATMGRSREAGIVVGSLSAEEPPGGGIQRYTSELLREILDLDSEAIALVASPRVQSVYDGRTHQAWPRRMAQGNFAGNLLRLGWHQTALPYFLRREGAQVFHSTTPDGMVAPVCPQVVTIHDLIPLLHPESAPRLKYHFRYVVPRIVAASTAVIAMSEATRSDLERLYGVSRSRVHVVYQGYRSEVFHQGAAAGIKALRERFGIGRYLLAMADGRSYKNIPRLIQAFARLRPAGVQLALVGRTSRKEVDLRAIADSAGVGGAVRFLEFVPDESLAALYAGAEAFVFPSLLEGFGIPPLEAMACGCPVVASDAASLPEVCGDAALYVDPRAVDAIAGGIERVLSDADLRAELRTLGPERATRFSYRAAATRVLEILRACGEAGKN